ncbi:Gfo/Idh/MocA family oxidoreductase [Sandaracinomonas limnophila]|uniref:Gfo/Idh/MocA family oxidoreductase n=1 Tax=Sandaracinomonas limnophila TaxID=1862386 RepID=A0A437PTH3_9BACT|nr:Gfo/Idh/MocA family oxidoreductase [Sandaracinomonas limnophila]RVU25539.1 Gfo/Idh/MocA family oxidoreductase [Sandaracinomonas limnophila]
MKNFALIGAAGYIAPRHMKAIKDTGNDLVAAFDPYDGVGIMDSHFPNADFFTEFERFDRHVDKLRRQGNPIDFISICSPNYLHDAHIRFALKSGCDVICEKPLVLNPWNLDAIAEIEQETGKRVYSILQLRLHPSIIALKEKIKNGPKDKVYDINLNYITSRGKWYHRSWKGVLEKSGGIATNIGVHFFDMLSWIFGEVQENLVTSINSETAKGNLKLKQANVNWSLSIDYNEIPEQVRLQGKRTYRTLTIEGEEIEFSDGFTELHTKSYEEILKGNGFGVMENKTAIEIVSKIRGNR